jgi:hypothetical protein
MRGGWWWWRRGRKRDRPPVRAAVCEPPLPHAVVVRFDPAAGEDRAARVRGRDRRAVGEVKRGPAEPRDHRDRLDVAPGDLAAAEGPHDHGGVLPQGEARRSPELVRQEKSQQEGEGSPTDPHPRLGEQRGLDRHDHEPGQHVPEAGQHDAPRRVDPHRVARHGRQRRTRAIRSGRASARRLTATPPAGCARCPRPWAARHPRARTARTPGASPGHGAPATTARRGGSPRRRAAT